MLVSFVKIHQDVNTCNLCSLSITITKISGMINLKTGKVYFGLVLEVSVHVNWPLLWGLYRGSRLWWKHMTDEAFTYGQK
jgi:hypothetical protein